MAEIINLRRIKKQRAKADEAVQSAENRVRHGRTRAEQEAGRAEARIQHRQLDGARLLRDREPGE